MSQSIASISDHYRDMVEQAEAHHYHIDSLVLSARGNLGSSVHKPLDPTAYRRTSAPTLYPQTIPIPSQLHWTRQYLKAITAPNPHWPQFHDTMVELLKQTADDAGTMSPPAVALFTSAASAFLHRFPVTEPLSPDNHDQRERRAFIAFAAGIARAYRPHAVDPVLLHNLVQHALATACDEVHSYVNAAPIDFNALTTSIDEHGIPRIHAAPFAAISEANQLANAALRMEVASPNSAVINRLQRINEHHLDEWRRHSAALFPNDAVPRHLHHYQGLQPEFQNHHLERLRELAHRAVRQAEDNHTIHPRTDYLQHYVTDPPEQPVTAERQERLATSLANLLRESRGWWSTHPTHFDEYARPTAAEFADLDRDYHSFMLFHGRILLAALRLELPELIQQRDAIIAAVSGSINHQARDDHRAYHQHPLDEPGHADRAQERLNVAAAVIAAMPDALVHPQARAAIAAGDTPAA